VFLIARTAHALARWDSVERRRKNAKANWKGYPIVTFLQETGLYEGSRRIKNGSRDLHRQVDTQGFVFAKRETLSARQLRRHIGIVSQHILTRTLRNLESTGLITRRVTRSKAIAVEYSLTQLGRTLITPLGGMCRWAKRHRRLVSAEVRLEEKRQSR
jgi:DNA-binding HxlR family transcriptional regulator